MRGCITFFVDPDFGVLSQENDRDWCLRDYKSLDGLTLLPAPANAPRPKRGAECLWQTGEDHPSYDNSELVVPAGFDNSEIELDTVHRTKIGGYASTIQADPWWGEEPDHPAAPKFCVQINSACRSIARKK